MSAYEMRIRACSSDVRSSDLLAAAICPTLTTIRQPIRDMSRAAMTLLAEAMKRGDEMNGRGLARLDYSLVRRQSDAVPRLNHRIGRESCRERVCQYV